MLRWCQSTVRALDGCGTSTISSLRLHSDAAPRRLTNVSRTGEDMCRTSPPLRRPVNIEAYTAPVRRSRRSPSSPLKPGLSAHVNLNSIRYVSNSATEQGAATYTANPDAVRDPLATLSSFLSRPKAHISTHPKISIDTLKSLYISLKSQSLLQRLSSKQLTELISLVGSLSLPPPRNHCIYFSNLVSHVDLDSTHWVHWPFVLEIAQDKEKLLRQTLNGTDRYWIMRAQLSKVAVTGSEELQADDARLRALSHATAQYQRLWRHTSDPEVHVPYFEALLSLHSTKHISELVQRVCKVLELHTNPNYRVIDILWQVLLIHGRTFTPEHKDCLLSMVSTRLSTFKPAEPKGRPPSAFKPFDPVTKRHRRVAVGITELSASLGNAVFPSYSPVAAPLEICRWASAQASRIFTTAVPRNVLWGNLLLLAINKVPAIPGQGSTPPEQLDADTTEWRTVFVLATLEKTLSDVGQLESALPRQNIQDIIRPLWRAWRESELKESRPITITRAVLASFFRVAEKVLDRPLVDGCHRFCIANGLLTNTDADTTAERLQITDLRVAFILASAACDGTSWQTLLSTSEISGAHWRGDVVEALMWHYIPRDACAAYAVYLFGKQTDLPLPSPAVLAMSISLATSGTWQQAVPFLSYPRFTRGDVEELLVAILHVFRVERREIVDPALVKPLGDVMWKLYAHQPPPERFKYPIRFFFAIMIASGHPSQAINIVEAVHRQVPDFFTTRLFLRLTRTLVRYRHIHLTERVLRLVPASSSRASDDFRRKLTLSLARAGADVTAHRVYSMGILRKTRLTTRESLARTLSFKVVKPSRLLSLQVYSILKRKPLHGPTIKFAASIFVRANRSHATRKLLEKTHGFLDQATKTSIGNTILHGFLKRHALRNGRLVRHTLRTKDILETRYGFVPDRVTMNIVIKAMLRWRQVIDPPKVKALFDHMVRCGYPASPRWRKDEGVPFGTPSSSPTLSVPALSSAISFERHVRPLYKMFIKALYARCDPRAAKVVVGILKEEESAARWRREERNRARHQGLARKKEREWPR